MLLPLLITASIALVTYSYITLRHKRFVQYVYIPQLPPSLLMGHLKTIDEYTRRGPSDRHPDEIFAEMHEKLGRPPLFIVDFRPIMAPLVLITNHEVAEQVAKASSRFPTSPHKSSLKYLNHLIGANSILSAGDEEWKALRKRFSPGFAPQHLMTLLPCILDKIPPFMEFLDYYAETRESFAFVPLVTNLTFDIIGSVVMDTDLNAQHLDLRKQGELVRLFSELLAAYTDDKADIPWWLAPRTELKRYRLGKRIDVLIKDIIRRKFAEQRNNNNNNNNSNSDSSSPSSTPNKDKDTTSSSRSILALSLRDASTLTPSLLTTTADQLKTFLLAGHDTTSLTISWACYELSLHPSCLHAVRAELDTLLGPDTDPTAIRAKLLSPEGPELVQKMTYTAAVIKEVLRLHPPAATARYTPPGTGFTVRAPNWGGSGRGGEGWEEYCLDGTIIYNCEAIMHRDTSVYGDTADKFVPERWLGGDGNSGGSSNKIPASAWRPFERGPRNCIGQEFANIEARVIIAHIARRYDFTKVGLGSILRDELGRPVFDGNGSGNGKGEYKLTAPLYKTRQVTSKPVDGMKVKVTRVA